MINALFAMVIVAAFFAGFGYMTRLAARCPGKQECDGEPKAAGCAACDRVRECGHDG